MCKKCLLWVAEYDINLLPDQLQIVTKFNHYINYNKLDGVYQDNNVVWQSRFPGKKKEKEMACEKNNVSGRKCYRKVM